MSDANRYPNLTLKKIPKMVLKRCEWAHDDYSLNIQNLPFATPGPTEPEPQRKAVKTTKNQPSLFEGGDA